MKINYINKFQREVEGEFPNIKTYDLTKNSLKEQKGISLNTIQENGKTVKENIKTFFDNTSPEQLIEQMGLQEQSILSIEDKANEYALNEWGLKQIPIEETVQRDRFDNSKEDFIAGAKSMLPIIKELGEALKIAVTILDDRSTGEQTEQFIQTTLDKYKQYL